MFAPNLAGRCITVTGWSTSSPKTEIASYVTLSNESQERKVFISTTIRGRLFEPNLAQSFSTRLPSCRYRAGALICGAIMLERAKFTYGENPRWQRPRY